VWPGIVSDLALGTVWMARRKHAAAITRPRQRFGLCWSGGIHLRRRCRPGRRRQAGAEYRQQILFVLPNELAQGTAKLVGRGNSNLVTTELYTETKISQKSE
jgi:hypothetical protein